MYCACACICTHSYSSLVPEESMVLNAVLPELLAAIVCVHVEPDSIVFATLLRAQPDMFIYNVHVYMYIHELYIMCMAHYKLQKERPQAANIYNSLSGL